MINKNHHYYYNKKINTINNTDKKYSIHDQIYNKIIPKQTDNKYNEKQFKELYQQKQKELNKNQEEAIKKRKNNPYKCIIKNFNYNKEIKNEDELVVFKARDDKRTDEEFKNDIDKYKNIVDIQDDENKKIYSEDNKINYIKNFEYVQKYKYKSNIDDNIEESGDNVRKDRIEYYEEKKMKDDKNATVINDIFADLIANNIISEDMENIDLDKLDTDDLEKKLIEQFGKEEYEKMINEIDL